MALLAAIGKKPTLATSAVMMIVRRQEREASRIACNGASCRARAWRKAATSTHAVQCRYPGERDKADRGRNRKRHFSELNGQDPAEAREGHASENKSRVDDVSKRDEEQHHDHGERQRDHDHQPTLRPAHVFELPAPFQSVATRQCDLTRDQVLCFGDETADIATAYVALDGDVTIDPEKSGCIFFHPLD
jgi:hypothetical protein